MIKKIVLNEITVFTHLELDVEEGINVLIGGNGTGKTHLLKLIYNTYAKNNWKMLEEKYVRNYDNKLYLSSRKYASNVLIVYVIQNSNKEENCWLQIDGRKECTNKEQEVIYIPAFDMLSRSKGLLALNQKYNLPYEEAELDIILKAELPETKLISEMSGIILNRVSEIIYGEVELVDGVFYVVKNNHSKIEFSMEAEGFRKLALLWKLVRNGLLSSGSILLWDEPEANINPELIPILIDLLLILKNGGVQIFVATHNYNLAKYFEVKREHTDDVIFHNFYKEDGEIKAESNTSFGQLKMNKIIEADTKLIDVIYSKDLEDY